METATFRQRAMEAQLTITNNTKKTCRLDREDAWKLKLTITNNTKTCPLDREHQQSLTHLSLGVSQRSEWQP
jgi:hypothetical protein